MPSEWEAIVVGGGAAGLNAALVLGRARRTTLLIDAGEQSNRPAEHVGGLMGQDHVSPRELYEVGRAQLEELDSVEVLAGEVVGIEGSEGAADEESGFSVATREGGPHQTGKLILATGQRYEIPDIPGLEEHWGRDVFHCPFCHGWEMRDRKVVVLDSDAAEHQAALIRGWTDDVSVVDPAEVSGVHEEDSRVAGLEMADGSRIACEGVMVKADLHDRDPIAESLGLERTEAGFVAIDDFGKTSVPGVFAAGDLAVAPQQVVLAMASGHLAATVVVRDLLLGDPE